LAERGRKGVYNRYIPDGVSYTRVTESDSAPPESAPPQPEKNGERQDSLEQERPTPVQTEIGPAKSGGGSRRPSFWSGKESLTSLFSGRERGGLSHLLQTLHLEDIDTGDVLLLLIVLYLLVEGDDLELVIALGLVLIMGLGEDKSGTA
jgi:hypothetical protein